MTDEIRVTASILPPPPPPPPPSRVIVELDAYSAVVLRKIIGSVHGTGRPRQVVTAIYDALLRAGVEDTEQFRCEAHIHQGERFR
jgi:hypothetical protein